MTKFRRYLFNKLVWFLIAFVFALVINFFLIRLIPGNPVDTMVSRMMSGGSVSGEAMEKIYREYMTEFGLDKPMGEQFIIYIGNIARGDLGVSFRQYPTRVSDMIMQALPWT